MDSLPQTQKEINFALNTGDLSETIIALAARSQATAGESSTRCKRIVNYLWDVTLNRKPSEIRRAA